MQNYRPVLESTMANQELVANLKPGNVKCNERRLHFLAQVIPEKRQALRREPVRWVKLLQRLHAHNHKALRLRLRQQR
jgi:hypothetical protein